MSNNFILAIGDRNSETLRTITEAFKIHSWATFHEVGEGGKEATSMYLKNGKNYALVVMAGGFAWEFQDNPKNYRCPIQSMVLTSYMQMWYKTEEHKQPEVIIYEPNADTQKLMRGMAKGQKWTWLTFVSNEAELHAALDDWWNSKIN